MEYAKLGAILLQETWVHNEIDEEITKIDGLIGYRVDRPTTYRKRGGGLVTYINNNWCKNVKQTFAHSTGHMCFRT
ncbi:unnamed protein product [Echinostoma caproni]|uniref:BRCT domain-containing protein n=1 Tax=Echinostoma caproni TaxID=27848 RepID=A0A183A4Y9_9TREM|nr:unnamed protein product [Echinostoma caproni]